MVTDSASIHVLAFSANMDVVKYQEKLQNKLILAQNGQCRIWTGTIRPSQDYGVINVRLPTAKTGWKTLYVHRLAFQFSKGWTLDAMTDSEMVVSHLCHNTLCCNPAHLTWESQGVNCSRYTCVLVGECQKHGDQHPDCLLHLKM